MKKYYSVVRVLHLYFGLFISPFVLVFSISVIVFNHAAFVGKMLPAEILPVRKLKLTKIPYCTTDLSTAEAITRALNINGEIDFISQNDDMISFPVRQPGFESRITVDKHTDSVYIEQQRKGTLSAMAFLHSMPGPHNQKMRGNSLFVQVWRVVADVVVYVLLFLSASGIFLWYFLKVERKPGLFSMGMGIVVFASLLLYIFLVL